MAHMRPEVWQGGMWVCEDENGEWQYFPDDVFSEQQAADECGLLSCDDVEHEEGWWGRLSAPGYLDQTEWNGPFETKKKALEYLFQTYDVDAGGDPRAEEGYEVTDDLDDDEDTLHGLGQDSTRPPRRNKKVHNLSQTMDGRWVFRYGNEPYMFKDEPMFFKTRVEAVGIAMRHGWIVEDNNRMRQAYTGGINGFGDDLLHGGRWVKIPRTAQVRFSKYVRLPGQTEKLFLTIAGRRGETGVSARLNAKASYAPIVLVHKMDGTIVQSLEVSKTARTSVQVPEAKAFAERLIAEGVIEVVV